MVSVTGHMVVYTVVYSVVVISPPGDVVETGPTGEEDGYCVRVSVITVVTVDTDSYVLVRVFHPDVYVAVTGQVVTYMLVKEVTVTTPREDVDTGLTGDDLLVYGALCVWVVM